MLELSHLIKDGITLPPSGQPTTYFVIPVYNEDRNIAAVVDGVAARVADQPWFVVAVDDGSRDRTPQILEELARRYPGHLQIVTHPQNRGIPDTLHAGLAEAARRAASGDRILVLEGDGTSDPDLYRPIVDLLDGGNDLVVASRYAPRGGSVGFPWIRRTVSRVGNWSLARLYRYPGLTDYSIFYRGYRADLVQRVLTRRGRAAFAGRHFSANGSFLFNCLLESPRVAEVAHVYHYEVKKSCSMFRVAEAALGYLELWRDQNSQRVRAVCREARRHAADTLSQPARIGRKRVTRSAHT
jgi:dolichol-phosphate mannosyltransferase